MSSRKFNYGGQDDALSDAFIASILNEKDDGRRLSKMEEDTGGNSGNKVLDEWYHSLTRYDGGSGGGSTATSIMLYVLNGFFLLLSIAMMVVGGILHESTIFSFCDGCKDLALAPIVFGVVLFLTSVAGYFGTSRRSRFLVVLYVILLILIALALLVLLIAALVFNFTTFNLEPTWNNAVKNSPGLVCDIQEALECSGFKEGCCNGPPRTQNVTNAPNTPTSTPTPTSTTSAPTSTPSAPSSTTSAPTSTTSAPTSTTSAPTSTPSAPTSTTSAPTSTTSAPTSTTSAPTSTTSAPTSTTSAPTTSPILPTLAPTDTSAPATSPPTDVPVSTSPALPTIPTPPSTSLTTPTPPTGRRLLQSTAPENTTQPPTTTPPLPTSTSPSQTTTIPPSTPQSTTTSPPTATPNVTTAPAPTAYCFAYDNVTGLPPSWYNTTCVPTCTASNKFTDTCDKVLHDKLKERLAMFSGCCGGAIVLMILGIWLSLRKKG